MLRVDTLNGARTARTNAHAALVAQNDEDEQEEENEIAAVQLDKQDRLTHALVQASTLLQQFKLEHQRSFQGKLAIAKT